MDQVDLEGIAERPDHGRGLAGAEEAVVHEEAGELLADGLVDERRHHGRVDAARERAEHPIVAHRLADPRDGRIHEGGHGPVALHPAGTEEVGEHGLALRGMGDFGVELDGVEAPLGVGHGRHRTVRRGGQTREPLGRPQHGVAVAHPHRDLVAALRRDPVEEPAPALDAQLGRSVLAPLRRDDLAAEEIGHGLHPVADAEHGNAGLEELRVGQRSPVVVDARGASREDETLVAAGKDLVGRLRARDDLGVHRHLPDPTRDQLGVLRPKIEDRDLVQALPPASAGCPASGPAGRPSLPS
jgi:hypothetical protein